MIVLTSFSPKGYELYGKRFLESFVENWPCNVIVYHEGQPDFQHDKVIYKPLDDVFGYQAFIQYCNRNPVFSGQTPMGYNYNYDAAKFCKKVFAQFDALKNNKGKVIWLDGDTFTKENVTEEWVNELFGDVGQEACLSFSDGTVFTVSQDSSGSTHPIENFKNSSNDTKTSTEEDIFSNSNAGTTVKR